jgi:hypothetical protein
MLDGSLLKSNYLGKDGFVWWIGQIAPAASWRNEKTKPDAGRNTKDPNPNEDPTGGTWAYRCRVRVIGYHTFNRDILKDEELPWAHVMSTATEGSAQGGVFETMRIVGGETAFGFFLDGDDAQQPVVVGLIHRNESVKNFPQDQLADQLRPFTGHTGPLRQGDTQIREKNPGQQEALAGNTKPADIGKTTSTPFTGNAQSAAAPSSGAIANATQEEPAKIPPLKSPQRDESKPGADQAIRQDLASQAFGDEGDVTIVRENGCTDNLIGKISKVLNEFIAYIGRIEEWIDAYIDPVLNTFVDIVQEIRGFARRIVGIIKFVINNLRGTIIKIITNLFGNFISSLLPLPQQPLVAEATKNIINIIFCLFEKLIPMMIQYIINLLTGLIGRAINAPLCAVEEWVAGILGKLMDFIDDLLGPVMSGLDWLLGGLSQITGLLSKASSIAQQILNFIGCDQLKCEASTEWNSRAGARKKERDNWKRSVEKLNVMKGVNQNIDNALAESSIYNYIGGGSPYRDCAERARQPKTQGDKTPVPNGVIADICIPPEIEIFGDGVKAEAVPIVGKDGGILSVVVTNPGRGYRKVPTINVVDNTGHGKGARLACKIRNGRIISIYVKRAGSGYCPGNYSTLFASSTYLVTADRYTIFEGEKVKFTVRTENVKPGTVLNWELNGDIEPGDVQFPGRTLTEATGPLSIEYVNLNSVNKSIYVSQNRKYIGLKDQNGDSYNAELRILESNVNARFSRDGKRILYNKKKSGQIKVKFEYNDAPPNYAVDRIRIGEKEFVRDPQGNRRKSGRQTEIIKVIGDNKALQQANSRALELKGQVTINDKGIGKQTIEAVQDSIPEPVETMHFDLYDPEGNYVARTTVLIANRLAPVLPPGPLDPIESPPGFPYPDDVFDDNILGGDFDEGDGGQGLIGITTGGSPFTGIGTGIGGPGFANTDTVGIVTSIVIEKPGFGYTGGDIIRVGICTFGVIVTPAGSIVGVGSIVCASEFDGLPEAEIITNTGEGAEVYPVLNFKPKFNKITVVNEQGIVNVVDCV